MDLGYIFFSSTFFFWSPLWKVQTFSIGYMQFISALPTHSPQLETSLPILALSSIKISAELLSIPQIIYLFVLSIHYFPLSFTKILTSHSFNMWLFYPQDLCKAEAFYMARKALCIYKELTQYLIIGDFTLGRAYENDSRCC